MSGQITAWSCPNCGVAYEVEDTGTVIRSRRYPVSHVMRFRSVATGQERIRCVCGRFLHFLFNGTDRSPMILPGRAR